MNPPLYEQEMIQGAERVRIGHRQDLFQGLVRWFDSQGLARPLPRHLELMLDMLQAAGVKEIRFSPAEDVANEIAIHAARAETRTVADQAQLEEQVAAARASFNRDVERERQAAAETCKAFQETAEALGKRVQELEAERDRLQKLATHLEGQIGAHRRAHQETSADAQAILEACGAQADVDEGRDPIEAARAVRDNLINATDWALACERTRDEWKGRYQAVSATLAELRGRVTDG